MPPAPVIFEAMFLPAIGVGEAIGDPQTFKSFNELEQCISIATGRPAFGTMKPNVTGTTIFCAGEGSRGLEDQRVLAYEINARKDDPDFDLDKYPFYTMRALPPASNAAEVEQFLAEIDATVLKSGQPLRKVVLDTKNKMLTGMDENAAGVAAMVQEIAERIKDKFGCEVTIIHHPAKGGTDKTGRGSGAGFGAIDWGSFSTVWHDKERDVSLIDQEITKDRDGPGEGEHVYFETVRVDLPYPEPRNRCLVLKHITKAQFDALKRPMHLQQVIDGERLDISRSLVGQVLTDRCKATEATGKNVCFDALASEILKYREELRPFPEGNAGGVEMNREERRIRRTLSRGCGIGNGRGVSDKFLAYVVPGTSGRKNTDLFFWFPKIDPEAAAKRQVDAIRERSAGTDEIPIH